ncbi:hypothetical protein [Halorussus caseinilyticus]|uniref:Carboxypeptidase regulatory-like domain-containing protein n=1 Tax=Halorussus caseinilyticus TaxID=3034025 RepID=A0ABD5WNC7_9EURY
MTVVDQNGNPVPDAEVEVMDFVSENGTKAYAGYTTTARNDGTLAAGGTAGIEVVGEVRVRVSPPDGSSGFGGPNYTDLIDVQSDTDLTLTLDGSGNTVSGQVDDADGDPSSDDAVVLESDATRDFEVGYTDSAGNFSVSGIESGSDYAVRYYQNFDAQTPFPQDGTADLYVMDRVNVSGDVNLGNYDVPSAPVLDVRVVDESGDPVPGATVSMTHRRLGASATLVNLTMDSQGYVAPGGTRGMELTGDVSVGVEPRRTPPGSWTRPTPGISR